jgi:hypothetical protein
LPVSEIAAFTECVTVPFAPMVTFPATLSALFTVRTETFVAAPMVSDLHEAGELILGWCVPVKLASPMIAGTVDVGTPFVQFPAVPQLVLAVPFHEV